MNEEYLKQFRKSPDSELVEKIYVRLEKRERAQIIKRYAFLSMLALVSMFGMLMTFSSTVRADVIRVAREIAGLQFDVTSKCPGCSDEDVTFIEPEYLSLENARSRFPSPVQLPTYIPQGYERRVDLTLAFTDPVPMLTIVWENKHIGNITLDIQNCSRGIENCTWAVGEGALEELMLNGNPAVVMRGAWNYETQQYDSSVGTAIQWKYDENTIYTLSSWNKDLPLEELIKMAESIP